MKKPFIILLICLFCCPLRAGEWQLIYNNNQLKLWRGDKNHLGFQQYKIKLTVSSNISAFINLLLDTSQAEKWITNIKSVELIDSPNKQQHIVMSRFHSPLFIKDRSLITQSTITPLNENLTTIKIDKLPSQSSVNKNEIEIPYFHASYQLEQTNNILIIQYQISASAGGQIPKWLVNKVLKQNLISTFKSLQTTLEENNESK